MGHKVSDDTAKKDHIQRLKERRLRLAEAKKNAENRQRLGSSVVEKVNAALKTNLVLDQFDTACEPPVTFARKPDFRDCPGLVAAHTSEPRAREILTCCNEIFGGYGGLISFDEYGFVGTASIEPVTFLQLLDAAKSLHDSVLFWPDASKAVVLIDHYTVRGVPRDVGFSIVIQGTELERKLASCFENVVQLGG